jgi:hypothetical protein
VVFFVHVVGFLSMKFKGTCPQTATHKCYGCFVHTCVWVSVRKTHQMDFDDVNIIFRTSCKKWLAGCNPQVKKNPQVGPVLTVKPTSTLLGERTNERTDAEHLKVPLHYLWYQRETMIVCNNSRVLQNVFPTCMYIHMCARLH